MCVCVYIYIYIYICRSMDLAGFFGISRILCFVRLAGSSADTDGSDAEV